MFYGPGIVPIVEKLAVKGRCLMTLGVRMDSVAICVAGGREFDDYGFLSSCMDSIKHLHYMEEVTLISGAARGADTLGEQYAEEQQWLVESHPPDYDVPQYLRKRAPFVRNQKMAEIADVLCAFWDGKSKGTKHMIGCAMKEGLEIHIFRYSPSE